MSGTHRHPPASMSSGAMSPTPTPTPTVVRLGADDDEDPWHVKIQYMLVEDYVKYLKTMGMRLIYVQSADKTIRYVLCRRRNVFLGSEAGGDRTN